jgi:hypothetical protein
MKVAKEKGGKKVQGQRGDREEGREKWQEKGLPIRKVTWA